METDANVVRFGHLTITRRVHNSYRISQLLEYHNYGISQVLGISQLSNITSTGKNYRISQVLGTIIEYHKYLEKLSNITSIWKNYRISQVLGTIIEYHKY